jgi:F-type H+-transporting ATPase subunit epsilon
MMALPDSLTLEIVTPEGLLLREEVDEVIVPGSEGYFGVRPGHTPFLTTVGSGQLTYRQGTEVHRITCFWGLCEVLADRVNVIVQTAERAEELDVARSEGALRRAAQRDTTIRDEDGFKEAQAEYIRAVVRLETSGSASHSRSRH